MPRIDSHAQVFAKESAEFPRECSDLIPADREALVETLLGEMEAHQIDQAVLVQAGGARIEHHAYLLHCLALYPQRFRGIGLIPDGIDRPDEHMDRLADGTGIIGFRLNSIGGPTDPFSPIDVRTFRAYPIWKHAATRDYVLSLYVRAADAFQIPYMLEVFPQVRVVINHMGICPAEGHFSVDPGGRPRMDIPSTGVATHATHRLMGYENVLMQMSRQYAFSDEPYPYKETGIICWTLAKIFPPDRLLWASDFPWIIDDPSYGPMMNIINEVIPNMGETAKAQLMGDNAAQRLGFPPVESDAG
jgi:L-fuconolactonase